MRTGMIKLKMINLKELPVTFIEEQRNQSQKKLRNKQRRSKNKQRRLKYKQKIRNHLALEPDLIRFDKPLKVHMLLDAPIPEPAARPKNLSGNVDHGLDKNVFAVLNRENKDYNIKMPSELLWAPEEELENIVDSFEQPQRSLAFKATHLEKKVKQTQKNIKKQ